VLIFFFSKKPNSSSSSSSFLLLPFTLLLFTCSSLAHPMTFSTPALLYHDRSKITISPALGRCLRYRCQYHCVFSVSVGLASATVRSPRWLSGAVSFLMTPPLPAASRPSKMTRTLRPLCLIQSWGVVVEVEVEVVRMMMTMNLLLLLLLLRSSKKQKPLSHLPADELDLELLELLVCFCGFVKREKARWRRSGLRKSEERKRERETRSKKNGRRGQLARMPSSKECANEVVRHIVELSLSAS